MPDDDYCYLTTRGRVTGDDHEIEIWYVRESDTAATPSTCSRVRAKRSDWVRNLQVDPAVTGAHRRRDLRTRSGRVVTEPDEDRHARTVVFDKYQPRNDGELVTWRERALPVALDLR